MLRDLRVDTRISPMLHRKFGSSTFPRSLCALPPRISVWTPRHERIFTRCILDDTCTLHRSFDLCTCFAFRVCSRAAFLDSSRPGNDLPATSSDLETLDAARLHLALLGCLSLDTRETAAAPDLEELYDTGPLTLISE